MTNKPRYGDLKHKIKENFEFVQTSVQKALIKSAAMQFSKLPFSEHMHSPIIDVIAYLLINERIELSQEIGQLHEKDREKYLKIIDTLEEIGLIQRTNNYLLPDNALIEIEHQNETLYSQLSNALAFYFSHGYENIQSVHQVVGPHLTISGYIYQQSIEYDDLTPVKYEEIRRIVHLIYRQDLKQIKIPRYLIQLNKVKLIELESKHGEDTWLPNVDVYSEP